MRSAYHRQDNEKQMFVIYNTCTVRENANLKVMEDLDIFTASRTRIRI